MPYVNINLSFVTMLCRPLNHKICFTCQYNLNPSNRRHSSIQTHTRHKILLRKRFNTHPSKSCETLYTTLHGVFQDHVLWELVNMCTCLLTCAPNRVLWCWLRCTRLKLFRIRFPFARDENTLKVMTNQGETHLLWRSNNGIRFC